MWNNNQSRSLRYAVVLGSFAVALALAPTATARVRVGVNVNIALPPHVHVSVGNYEPYYVGRVFYQPLGVWRPVYSFPVETPDGVVYEPYVYDRGRVVCHSYIPGVEAGYGQFVIEGRGRYNPHWYRGDRQYRAYDRFDQSHDRGWHARDNDHRGGRGHDRGGHDRDDRSGRGHGDHHHRR